MTRGRCEWAGDDPAMVDYHDRVWGVPHHDDRRLFELLTLEAFQSGLSWRTILLKQAGFRDAFAGFDPRIVAGFDAGDVTVLLDDASIVRNRRKIEATIANARATLAVQNSHGSLDAYLWSFVDGNLVINSWERLGQLPAATPASTTMSRQLKRDGFRFVGPTVAYSFMQASGMVMDHTKGCFRYRELGGT